MIIISGKIATMTRMAGGQKTVISWQDAPDDLFFRSTPASKKVKLKIRRIKTKPLKIILFQSNGYRSLLAFLMKRLAQMSFLSIQSWICIATRYSVLHRAEI